MATGVPRPDIMWYFNGVQLNMGGQVSYTLEEDGDRVISSTLSITRPYLEWIGNYTCEASNIVASISSSALVDIQGAYVVNTVCIMNVYYQL